MSDGLWAVALVCKPAYRIPTPLSNRKERQRWPSARCVATSTTSPSRFMPKERTHIFDSFECAIHALAPTCAHCSCRVIGHGVEADGEPLLRPLRPGGGCLRDARPRLAATTGRRCLFQPLALGAAFAERGEELLVAPLLVRQAFVLRAAGPPLAQHVPWASRRRRRRRLRRRETRWHP